MPLNYLQAKRCLEVATISKQYKGLSKLELHKAYKDLNECFIVARCNGFASICAGTADRLHAIEMIANGVVYTFISFNAFR